MYGVISELCYKCYLWTTKVDTSKDFFKPFYTLFSPSSDIQRVWESHPSACLTNYSKGIFMVSLAHPLHAPFMHFKSMFITVNTAAKAPFSSLGFFCLKNSYSLASLFVDEFCGALTLKAARKKNASENVVC